MPRTSELSRAFSTALGKLESAVKKLDVAVANTRHMYVLGAAELAYAAALRCAAEQATLLARALPAYTGSPFASMDVETITAANVPVEIGFTAEGWFSVRIPLLLPKKERGSAEYVRSILLPALRAFFAGRPPVRFEDCVLICRHVYAEARPGSVLSTMIFIAVSQDTTPSRKIFLSFSLRSAASSGAGWA